MPIAQCPAPNPVADPRPGFNPNRAETERRVSDKEIVSYGEWMLSDTGLRVIVKVVGCRGEGVAVECVHVVFYGDNK